jgi:predicted ferric reductase
MLWRYYVLAGSYSAELARLYWIWGIVGTVAVCAIIPFSVLQIRQKLYEFFLASHIVLSLLFLIGYYYHIWYVYTYNWGYEIWMFVVAGIWALERLLRIVRMIIGGSHTAIVSVTSDTDDEYLQLEVEGKNLKDGVAYLCFPTLGWRFWETHPFSVSGASKFSPRRIQATSDSRSSQEANATEEKGPTTSSVHVQSAQSSDNDTSTIFFARARSGFTKLLREKAVGSEGKQVRLRVLIEGPYNHSGHVRSQLAQCSSILVIAGGVGITACLPIIKENAAKETNLFWSSRKGGLVADLEPTISSLPSNVMVKALVGERFNLDAIIYEEMVEQGGVSKGMLGIVVSGPPEMADDVRSKVTQIARNSDYTRPYVLIDEAFSW